MSEADIPSDHARTARPCPMCGETVDELPHTACLGLFKDVMKPSSSSGRSSIDDMPEEVEEVSQDPTRKLNQYILVSQIGRGGMGVVWKAWDTKLTRWAAIKFLSATEPDDILRFEREAKLAARLRHPNIAAIYEVGESIAPVPGSPVQHYLAMEFIDGQTLSTADDRPLSDWLKIFVQVGRAVETAHQAGVVHRDLKPHNIMINREDYPYVMDFGLAKSLKTDTSLSASGAVMGTPSYMPPEQAQARHNDVDERSDTYSLGATLYSVLCKSYPFDGQSAIEVLSKVCNEDPRPPRELNPDLPVEIEAVLLKAMAKEKSDRYQTAGDLADDLQLYLSAGEVAAVPPSPLKKTYRKVKRSPITYGVVMAAVAFIVYLIFQPDPPPPIEPPPEPDPAALKREAEDAFRRHFYLRKYQSALSFLKVEENGRHFTAQEKAGLIQEAKDDCNRFLFEELEDFRLNLEPLNSAYDLATLSEQQFKERLALPLRDELFIGGNLKYKWASTHLTDLEKVHRGEASGRSLLAMARTAVSLEEGGQNPWFREIVEIIFEDLKSALTREVDTAQNESSDLRESRKKKTDTLMAVWKELRKDLSSEFLKRHGFLETQNSELEAILKEWPKTEDPAGFRTEALRALTDRVRLDSLESTRLALIKKDRARGLAIESRQSLYTWILIVEAHRRMLLVGSAQQAVAQGPVIQEYAKKVKDVGGPTDDYTKFGPSIEAVFKEALR